MCTIPDIEHSVLRPVVFDVVRQVMDWTRSKDKLPIAFPGEAEVVAQPNSTIDQDQDEAKLPTDTKVFIEAELEYEEDRTTNMATHQDEHMPFFFDPALGVSLRPVYCPSVIKLTFKLREPDKNAARQWRDDMRARIARYRGERLHTVGYYYMIPPVYARLLVAVQERRELIAPYGDTVAKYLRDHFAREVTTRATLSGSEKRLVVNEHQGRVSGFFDFDLPEKSQKDNESSAQALSFSYTVKLDIPIAVAADFPWLVHQQFLPSEFYVSPEDLRPEKVATRASKSMAAFRHFEADVRNRSEKETAIRIPAGNEYRPENPPSHMMLTMAVLTTMANDETGNLLPMMNLGNFDANFHYHQEWLDFIRGEREHITKYGASPLYLGVTVGDNFVHPELYELTEDLDVVFKGTPNFRAQYHVALYASTDPSMLDGDSYERFTDDPEGLWLFVMVVCPRLITNNALPQPTNGRYTVAEVKEIMEKVRMCNRSYSQAGLLNDGVISMKLVDLLGIDVERRK